MKPKVGTEWTAWQAGQAMWGQQERKAQGLGQQGCREQGQREGSGAAERSRSGQNCFTSCLKPVVLCSRIWLIIDLFQNKNNRYHYRKFRQKRKRSKKKKMTIFLKHFFYFKLYFIIKYTFSLEVSEECSVDLKHSCVVWMFKEYLPYSC